MNHPHAGQDIFLDIFDAAPTRDLDSGQILINAGATADHVFNVLSGMLMVSRTGGDGRRQVLSFLVRDNFVGLTATDNYFFTVEAVMPTRVACLSRRALGEHLASNAESSPRSLSYSCTGPKGPPRNRPVVSPVLVAAGFVAKAPTISR